MFSCGFLKIILNLTKGENNSEWKGAVETIQDELNTTEEKPRILNMKNDWNNFFLKYPSL